MASFSVDARSDHFSEQAAWDGLKKAIANSSGFKSWKLEQHDDQHLPDVSLETLVYAYLRETLATLAY
jgi:hypothetical protein